jgi:signal transduction histidine kinase
VEFNAPKENSSDVFFRDQRMSEQESTYQASETGSAPSKSFDLIEEKGRKLHLILIYLVAAYSLAYCIVNVMIGQTTQAYITAFILPSVFITWLLNKKGYYYSSKLWNAIQINVIIVVLALITGPETYISAFFIPIIIGTLVTLQGRERTTGYMLSLLSVCLMAFTLVTDIRILDVSIGNEDSLRVERIANMIGVGIISAMEVIYILRTSNDIQNQLVAQTALLDERNSQMVAALYTRDKMMSMLSHDLRSPIASIHAGMELFETGTVDADLQARLYTQMKSRTGQTLALMDKLLMWSRSQTRTIIYREEPLSIAQIEQFARSVCYLFASEKLINFTYRFDVPPGSMVKGDRDMIEAIFRNLISNAIKFTLPGGNVTIAGQEKTKSWVFSISDNGKGMTKEEIEKITGGISFTTSGTDREKGHGLGMQLVQDFIRKHNSSLKIDSMLEQGTTFSFELPKA